MMEWCNGTQIFDDVAKLILENRFNILEEDQELILNTLASALYRQGWNSESDSEYFDHPLVQKILKELKS